MPGLLASVVETVQRHAGTIEIQRVVAVEAPPVDIQSAVVPAKGGEGSQEALVSQDVLCVHAVQERDAIQVNQVHRIIGAEEFRQRVVGG